MAETRRSSRLNTKAKRSSAATATPSSKSVYFEESDDEPEQVRNSAASKKPPLKSRYFDPDFRAAESEEDNPQPKKKKMLKKSQTRNPRKRAPSETDQSEEEEPINKRKSMTEILQSKSELKLSSDESDSSSDESQVPANNTVHVSEDEPVYAEPEQTQYFDFTSVLSKVSQSNETAEKKEANSETSPLRREPSVQPMEVCELLAMGEDVKISAKDIKKSVTKTVEKYEIPKQIEVFLDGPVAPKSKRKGNDLEAALRRRLNSIQKEKQVDIHKVHVLCCIAHGLRLNAQLNSSDVLGMALSLLPNDKCYPPKRMNMEYLENLINWFHKKILLKKEDTSQPTNTLVTRLEAQLQNLEASSKTDLCLMFISVLRALGIKCRLIINLNAAPLKPPSDQLLAVNLKPEEAAASKTSKPPEKKSSHSSQKKPSHSSQKKPSHSSEKSKDKKSTSSRSKGSRKESEYFKEASKQSTRPSGRSAGNSQSNYFPKDASPRKKPKADKKEKDLPKEQEECFIEEMSTSDDSDEEEVFVPVKKKKIDRRVLSSDEESVPEQKSKTKSKPNKNNYWSEVFLEAEEKWVCVDIVKKSYHCAQQLYNGASHPVRYVLAFNNDQTIKDVTKRYVPQYVSVTRKQRVEDYWWACTLKPYAPTNTPQNREEDEELDRALEELPVPATVSEIKSHPLYVLQRHLLKFQAIYPPDSIPVGYIKGEPVYSRICVQQLHGREMWIKEAKVVKLGEKPYKVVKGRQKKDKFGVTETPRDLELFGSWQTEDYVPPVAKDGIVPRNAFGNVELFKPSMLPVGTVHLQLPGLQRIASKLNIDCAAAITGFDYTGCGWSYPVKDGFVVCEEYQDILLDAYNQEVEEAEKREKQKREERVYANWKRLIKGLFIREKLKRKYNFGDPGTSSTT